MASKILLILSVAVVAVSTALIAAPTQSVQNYVIGPQDVVAIMCLDDPALTGKFTVEADGTFTLPYIGSVKATGLTMRQLEQALKKSLIDGRFLKNPQITVTIDQYRRQHVILTGEVDKPGVYPLTPGMTLLNLIVQAGALTSAASGAVLIVPARATKAESADGGGATADSEIVRADFSQLQNGVFDRTIELRDGDIVIVQQAERAYVLGEVRAPGAYPVQLTTTLQQLLALAGGQTVDAALGRIKITRFVNGERIEVKNAALTELVKPGDTVVIPTKFF